jgi:hypothetical protein
MAFIILIERRSIMNEMKPYQIDHYKKAYPPGTRIELIANMFDEDIPKGTRGTVVAVDDIGTLHTNFDNGRSLGVLPNLDSFKKIEDRSEPTIQGTQPYASAEPNKEKVKKKTQPDHSR